MNRIASAHLAAILLSVATVVGQSVPPIGHERAITRHLPDDVEPSLPAPELIEFGRLLFAANWTIEDGAGRPMSTGSGRPLADASAALRGGRAFNRISGPTAMSCWSCHRHPYGMPGGGGDFVSNVFEGAERFDFVTFDRRDRQPTRGAMDETGSLVTLQTIGNLRATPSLYGAGYLELLARQMTADLQRIRDLLAPGRSAALTAKGVSFGTLARTADGRWDTSAVEGLPPQSLATRERGRPALVIRPWQHSGTTISLRDAINTAYHQHIGIQTTERFGANVDPDGDGVSNEMTRGDVTAVAAFIATLPIPGRIVPESPGAAAAVRSGERLFEQIGCGSCHVSSLPLEGPSWTYSEPGPYTDTDRRGNAGMRPLTIDLTARHLPQPRLNPSGSVLLVPAFTDFRLHDITDPSDASMQEPLDLNHPAGSVGFRQGNRRFLTRRLWDVGSQAQFFHDGRFTTIRDAVMAHAGEALSQRQAYARLSAIQQGDLLRFLESLQVSRPLPSAATRR